MSERIQKLMARAGIGSRRYCEDLIRAGRVKVNGVQASVGDRVESRSVEITVDGKPIQFPDSFTYIKLHKPAGYLCSRRSQGGNPTIYDLIDTHQRVFPVGRLDLQSEGLVLLTDDGAITHRLTHPRYKHEKEYKVLFEQLPTHDQVKAWEQGVQLPDGYWTQPSIFHVDQEMERGVWCRITLREGRKRQIRMMASVLGLKVLRLIRIRIATVTLGGLPSGQWREFSPEEVASLRDLLVDE